MNEGNGYPKIKVVGAPGYDDFSGELCVQWDDWPYAVVRFEHEGSWELAVVPVSCVTLTPERGE